MTCICETVEPLSLLNYCLTYWSVTYYSNHVLGIRDLWLTHFQCLSSHANQCTMHCLAYIVLIYTWPYVVIWVVLKTAHWLVNSTKCLKIFSEVHWPLPGKDSTGGDFGQGGDSCTSSDTQVGDKPQSIPNFWKSPLFTEVKLALSEN